MIRIKIAPLSVNKVWRGRRFKTEEYKAYEQEMFLRLPPIDQDLSGKLKIYIRVGFSNKLSDIDNCVKPFLDILQKTYGFDDRNIYLLEIEKFDVKKKEEYIEFEINSF